MSKFSRIVFLVVLLLTAAGIAIGQTVHWRIKLNTGQVGQVIAGPNDTDPAIMTFVQSTGNVGLGITDPGASRLTIRGVDNTSSNYGLKVENSAGTALMVVRNDGNVGIGTAAPLVKLDLLAASGWASLIGDGLTGFGIYNNSGSTVGTYSNHPLYLSTNNQSKAVITIGNNVYQGTNDDWKLGIGVAPITFDARMVVCRRGNMSSPCILPAGTTVMLLGSHDNSSEGSSIRAKGSIAYGLSDIGEYVKVEGEASIYDQGDALVIASSGLFKKSQAPYDKKVAGIVNTTAGLIGGIGDETINFDENGRPTNRVIIVLAGQVLAKTTTENGPIAVGDFLTTASTPGHLMKCPTDTNEQKLKCLGAIVGKALEPLESGQGKIIVLLTLQ